MTQETPNGFFYITLPDETLSICKEIGNKTGQSVGEVIADSIQLRAKQVGVILG